MGSHYDGTEDEVRALSAFINLSRAANALAAEHARRLSKHGLTLTQFGVLEALYHLGPMPQKDLGRRTLKTSGNMTVVIDNLVRMGLVERERRSDDRRFVAVHLTKAGRKLLVRMLADHVAGVVGDMELLSAEEQDRLRRMCRLIGKK